MCEVIVLPLLFLLPDVASLSYKIFIANKLSSGECLLLFVNCRHWES